MTIIAPVDKYAKLVYPVYGRRWLQEGFFPVRFAGNSLHESAIRHFTYLVAGLIVPDVLPNDLMPRPLRIECQGVWYHAMNRGRRSAPRIAYTSSAITKRHGFDGPLIQWRYKSILVSGDSYLSQLVRHIHKTRSDPESSMK